MTDDVLDEAYERLHSTGPEWGGNLSNHGPMVAETLARRGRAEDVPGWVDRYARRLEELPGPASRITGASWRDALGGRVGDWIPYFADQLADQPWRAVLATWWPRLLPGIAAGATHGVIRTGHAVRTLLAGNEHPAAIAELAHALGFWAARFVPVPGARPTGTLDAATALDRLPRLAEQHGPIRDRLTRLGELGGWNTSVAAFAGAQASQDAASRLGDLVHAATLRYLTHGYASPILLVHTATAPNAVRHVLPALPETMWPASLAAAWAASAAITATYGPAHEEPQQPTAAEETGTDPVAELVDRAITHGDEHVIKFSDTAAEVYASTGDPRALAAARRAAELIDPA
jgi:Questin oxidase-like